jgi:predicted permease
MLDVLAITSPIFIAIALGFLTTRAGLFERADMRVLGRFVVHLALPALLFRLMATRPLAEILNATYLLAYLGGSLAVLAGAWFWHRRVGRLDEAASAFRAMGMGCANSGFVGYPILLLMFAPVAGVSLALNMLVENVVLIPLVLLLAERGRAGAAPGWRAVGASLLRLGRNPMILAIFAGLAVSLVGARLPSPLSRAIELFAAASAALSLFVIGGSLVGLPLQGLGREIAPIAAGKLLLHPLAVGVALWTVQGLGLPPLEPMLRNALVLMAATPMLSIYPALAQPYRQERIAAPALLVTTLASFFTLSAVMWMLGSAGR